MAANQEENGTTLDALYASSLQREVEVTVLSVQRQCLASTLQPKLRFDPLLKYAYDLEVCDEKCKTVVFLHPSLSGLVEGGILSQGQRISVRASSLLSSRNGQVDVPIVLQLQLLDFDSARGDVGFEANSVQWHTLAITDGRPSLAPFLHYLPQHSDDTMQSVFSWKKSNKKLAEARVLLMGDESPAAAGAAGETRFFLSPLHPNLADRMVGAAASGQRAQAKKRSRQLVLDNELAAGTDVMDFGEGGGGGEGADDGREQDVLIGRLAAVGRIVHWGAGAAKSSPIKVPFKAEFKIVDNSRWVKVVLWNTTAAYYHAALAALPLGTPIGITGFRLKSHDGFREVSLNVDDPPGRVFRLLPDDLARVFGPSRLPFPDLRFTSSQDLMTSTLNGTAVSFTGLVARVGPLCRCPSDLPDYDNTSPGISEPRSAVDEASGSAGADALLVQAIRTKLRGTGSLAPSPSSGPWQLFRYVWVRDGVSVHDVVVKVFAHSRGAAFGRIQAGVPIVLTHLRAVSLADGEAHSAGSQRPLYLACSDWTSLFLGNSASTAEQPLAIRFLAERVPLLRDVLQWRSEALAAGVWFAPSPLGLALRPQAPWRSLPSLCRPPSLAAYKRMFFQKRAPQLPAEDASAAEPYLLPAELARLQCGSAAFAQAVWAAVAAGARGGSSSSSAAHAAPPTLGDEDSLSSDLLAGASSSSASRPRSVAFLASQHLQLQMFQHFRVIVIGVVARVDQTVLGAPQLEQQPEEEGQQAAARAPAQAKKPRGRSASARPSERRAGSQQRRSKGAAPVSREVAMLLADLPDGRISRRRGSSSARRRSASAHRRPKAAPPSAAATQASSATARGRLLASQASGGGGEEEAGKGSSSRLHKRKELEDLQGAWIHSYKEQQHSTRGTRSSAGAGTVAAPSAAPGAPAEVRATRSSQAAAAPSAAPPAVSRGAVEARATRSSQQQAAAAPPPVTTAAAAAATARVRGKATTAPAAATDAAVADAAAATSDGEREQGDPRRSTQPAAAPRGKKGKKPSSAAAAPPAAAPNPLRTALVGELHEDWGEGADDDGSPVSLEVLHARGSAPITVLTVSDVNDPSSSILLPLRTSSLLPHSPGLPASLAPYSDPLSPVVEQDPEAPSLDSDLDALRSFFPASSPRERIAFVQHLAGRRYAFCVTVHQRSLENIVDTATGTALDAAAAAAQSPEDAAKRRGRRVATLRLEAVYDLSEEKAAAGDEGQ